MKCSEFAEGAEETKELPGGDSPAPTAAHQAGGGPALSVPTAEPQIKPDSPSSTDHPASQTGTASQPHFPELSCPLCGGPVDSRNSPAAMKLFLRRFGPMLGLVELPPGFLLSVVIPVYNERHTIEELVRRVEAVPIPKEIIIVDDASTDGTRELVRQWQSRPGFCVLFHERNRGKGAAIRTGLTVAKGDVVLIQDADLEYDPVHYPELIHPIVSGVADVVYGSRFLPAGPHRVLYFWHAVANWVITTLSNMFTDLNLTDVETCYKAFRGDVIRAIAPSLREEGFGFEIEVTAKVARRRLRIYEVGISYFGRTYAEGKKIRFRDAVHALWCIVRYSRWD